MPVFLFIKYAPAAVLGGVNWKTARIGSAWTIDVHRIDEKEKL